MQLRHDFEANAEWLEADGRGGFASGTAELVRTRRYHALLLAAATPPTGRIVLVNGVEAWVEHEGRTFALTTQRYAPDVLHPDGRVRIAAFAHEPWPEWRFVLEDGSEIRHEVLALQGIAATALAWRAMPACGTLCVRLLLSGRDYHSLHRENPAFRFDPAPAGGGDTLAWHPYEGVPAIVTRANGRYAHTPAWYRSFLYTEERERGLDCLEDLASPGVLRFDLAQEALLLLATRAEDLQPHVPLPALAAELRAQERRRRGAFASPLHRAADQYIVRGGRGTTIVAGYPWFTDWGRDTFLALRGLCLATGRVDEAREILVGWAAHVSGGMLPNRFPDRGAEPEYNAVDASLWYVVAVHEYLRAAHAAGRPTPELELLRRAVLAIVDAYAAGTRFSIRMDRDGLLACGEPGVQLTWMDAKTGDHVVTPRIGKPVEVQALWLNALRIAHELDPRRHPPPLAAEAAFAQRFVDPTRGALFDVVDVDHVAGSVDPSLRPNQMLAVGGLPFALLHGELARRVVDTAEQHLLTPLGLRTLAPGEPAYVGRYRGGPRERDGAYHQGVAWPWLLGPFVEAWVRVRGGTLAARAEARDRFMPPLHAHLTHAGLGHVSEITDAEPPFTPRGCPFQAWSLAELLRLEHVVLAGAPPPRQPAAAASTPPLDARRDDAEGAPPAPTLTHRS